MMTASHIYWLLCVRYYAKQSILNWYIQSLKNFMRLLLLFYKCGNKKLNKLTKFSMLLTEFQGFNTSLSNFNILFLLFYLWGIFCSYTSWKQHITRDWKQKQIWESNHLLLSETLKRFARMYIMPKRLRTTALTYGKVRNY